MRIGFIGAGRVARTLAPACAACGHAVVAVASRTLGSAQALARVVPTARAYERPQGVVDAAELIFLTVPDDAIASTAAALDWRPDKAVVHCSGATELNALDVPRAAGAAVGALHPLQAFTDPALAQASLPGCAAALEAEEPLRTRLLALAADLGLKPFTLPPGARSLYHLSGSYAASFIDVLLHEGTTLWERFGIDRSTAVSALMPLAHASLQAIERLGTVEALTGPISRGDAGSVARHFEALARQAPDQLPLYALLAQRSLDLARRRGTLNEAQYAALATLIAAHLPAAGT